MAKKIYLSFLGTTNYLACNYKSEKRQPIKIEDVRFVQEATISWHCRDWAKDDEIVIFTTKDAKEKNWLDNGQKDRKSGEAIKQEGLETRIKKLNLAAELKRVDIPDGKREDEIWEIFSMVFERVEEGDTLYFDITHGFRNLPLLAMVIINYARVVKNIKVASMDYGAMEAVGNSYEIKDRKVKDRNIPIFDLLAFAQLFDWSMAIDRFISAGDVAEISRLTEENTEPILKETRGEDAQAKALKGMGKALQGFSSTIATCRGRKISETAVKLQESIAMVGDQQLIKPMTPLIEKLADAVGDFVKDDEVRNGIAAGRWCLNHNLIQQGYTILQETMLSFIVIQSTGKDPYDKKYRELVGKGVNIAKHRFILKKREKFVHEHLETVERRVCQCVERRVCQWLEKDGKKDLHKSMRNLSNLRNDLNHAGMKEDPTGAEKFAKNLKEYLDTFSSEVDAISKTT